MSLRFLILNADYSEFLHSIYAKHAGLEEQPYEEQMRVRNESMFGVADFYSSNLRKLGHQAWDIYPNNEVMQKAWAREHGIHIGEPTPAQHHARAVLQQARRVAARSPLQYLKPLFRPVGRFLHSGPVWFYNILGAQIRHYKPDILLNQAMHHISSQFLKEIKHNIRLLVGQIASPMQNREEYIHYDLIISSLPNFVYRFRQMGIPAELHRFGFEPRVLKKLKQEGRKTAVSFVGSVLQHHEARRRLLGYLCRRLDLELWARIDNNLPSDSLIPQRVRGSAWGIHMYQILYNSKMTLNHHIDVAESYANNMRLFEATGVGTLLVTDWQRNLHEMFEPGKEVVAYGSPEECLELIHYYLEHDDQREAIARAGQERTLREHTYHQRMQELVDIIRKFL